MDAAVPVAAAAQLLTMFASVMGPAQWQRVCLISFATINPRCHVVDIAKLGSNIATPEPATDRQQLCCLARFASEQSLRATHIDHHVMSINHHAPDTAHKHGLQRNIRMHSNTGRGGATTRGWVDLGHIGEVDIGGIDIGGDHDPSGR